jgi:hypothetical protein
MGEGRYAHRCTHGGPPRPHLIVQCCGRPDNHLSTRSNECCLQAVLGKLCILRVSDSGWGSTGYVEWGVLRHTIDWVKGGSFLGFQWILLLQEVIIRNVLYGNNKIPTLWSHRYKYGKQNWKKILREGSMRYPKWFFGWIDSTVIEKYGLPLKPRIVGFVPYWLKCHRIIIWWYRIIIWWFLLDSLGGLGAWNNWPSLLWMELPLTGQKVILWFAFMQIPNWWLADQKPGTRRKPGMVNDVMHWRQCLDVTYRITKILWLEGYSRYQRSRRWSNGTIIRSIGSPFTCCTHVTHMTHRVYRNTPFKSHHCGDEGLTVDAIYGSDSCLVHGRQKEKK